MTKFLTAAALVFAVAAGTIATNTPAEAGPTYSINGGSYSGNPFGAVNGR